MAQALGWRYCDRTILRRTAAALKAPSGDQEPGEPRSGTFLETLFRVAAFASPECPFSPAPERPLYDRQLFEDESIIMRELVERASAVLVGRGAFVALAQRPATLHVHIHASEAFRIQRLLDTRQAAGAAQAREAIRTSDRERSRFIREISGRDWLDPANYDLVLDSSQEGLAGCANRIVQAARARFPLEAGEKDKGA
jgi:cytidylate kinase